jgi:hypothetical protein
MLAQTFGKPAISTALHVPERFGIGFSAGPGSRRFVKKQQMQWTLRGAHLLLQTRTKVLNEDLDDLFRSWYPRFRPQPPTQEQDRKAA